MTTGQTETGIQESRKTTLPEPAGGNGPQHREKDDGGGGTGRAWDKEMRLLEPDGKRLSMRRQIKGCCMTMKSKRATGKRSTDKDDSGCEADNKSQKRS